MDELQKKSNELKGVSDNLNNQIEALKKRQAEVEKVYHESVTKLEHIAGMTADEAKQQLVDTMTEEARAEASTTIMDIVEEAKQTAAEQAKKIVIQSIQRTATETAVENTVSVFNLENEEVKGRIIGREGSNIRTLESLTGVEAITTRPTLSSSAASTLCVAKSPACRSTSWSPTVVSIPPVSKRWWPRPAAKSSRISTRWVSAPASTSAS